MSVHGVSLLHDITYFDLHLSKIADILFIIIKSDKCIRHNNSMLFVVRNSYSRIVDSNPHTNLNFSISAMEFYHSSLTIKGFATVTWSKYPPAIYSPVNKWPSGSAVNITRNVIQIFGNVRLIHWKIDQWPILDSEYMIIPFHKKKIIFFHSIESLTSDNSTMFTNSCNNPETRNVARTATERP